MNDKMDLAKIDKALADFNDAVDREDMLAAQVYAAVCVSVLALLRDQLRTEGVIGSGTVPDAERADGTRRSEAP